MDGPIKITRKLDITVGHIRQVAVMASTGTPKSHIQKQLNMTPFILGEILAMPECVAMIDEVNSAALGEAKIAIKQGLSSLAKEAVQVVKNNLKKDSLEAAKTVFKALGVDGSQEENKADNSFTLVLATDKGQETITVRDAKDVV